MPELERLVVELFVSWWVGSDLGKEGLALGFENRCDVDFFRINRCCYIDYGSVVDF